MQLQQAHKKERNWVRDIALIGLFLFVLATLVMMFGQWKKGPEITEIRKEIKL